MIIFGSRSAYIGSKMSANAICSNCQTQGKIRYSVFSSHAHVFWIPVFPMGKTGVSECQHCKQTLRVREMPAKMQQECNATKKEMKAPIWQFSGLFVIGALIVLAGFASKKDKKNEAEYLIKPLVGDIYDYKTNTDQYSTMKIAKVTTDSVFVQLNDYEISRSSKIYKIDKEKNYADTIYGYSIDEIKSMYDEEIIIDIDRD